MANLNKHNVSKQEEALLLAKNDMISFGKLFLQDDFGEDFKIINKGLYNNDDYEWNLRLDTNGKLGMIIPDESVDVNCPCATPPHDPRPQPVDATSTAGPTG